MRKVLQNFLSMQSHQHAASRTTKLQWSTLPRLHWTFWASQNSSQSNQKGAFQELRFPFLHQRVGEFYLKGLGARGRISFQNRSELVTGNAFWLEAGWSMVKSQDQESGDLSSIHDSATYSLCRHGQVTWTPSASVDLLVKFREYFQGYCGA